MLAALVLLLLGGGGIAASLGLVALDAPVTGPTAAGPSAAAEVPAEQTPEADSATPRSSTTAQASPSPSPRATPSAPPPATPTPAPDPTEKAAPGTGRVAVSGVVDGDTIKVRVGGGTERVRVIGIDTPELKGEECYARQAASRMQSLVQSRSVTLVRDPTQADRDRYDRLLRHVVLEDGRQAAQVLIAEGFGEEYTYDAPYAGQAAYRAAEASARKAAQGIWSSGCRDPGPVVPPPSTDDCLIKGNIASDGEKIYHVPGQRYYEVTKISESKGERWFCSESEARDAGWRAAKL